MALTFSVGGGGGNFKRVPAGTHLAICNVVADLGMQPGSQMYPAPKRKVALRFEIPSERVEYEKDGKKIEGPQTITATFTASMGEKANLRKFLEGWRGKKFSDDEASKFDVSSVLGKACLLNVTETERGGETYSNASNASPLLKGMEVPKPENPLVYYAEDNRSQFDQLPKRIKEKIEGQLTAEQTSVPHEANHDLDDDIPF